MEYTQFFEILLAIVMGKEKIKCYFFHDILAAARPHTSANNTSFFVSIIMYMKYIMHMNFSLFVLYFDSSSIFFHYSQGKKHSFPNVFALIC